MPREPWKQWVPGVLAPSQVAELAQAGYLRLGEGSPEIDGSAFDLRLGGEAYRLLRGSVKPWGVPEFRQKVLRVPTLCERMEPEDGVYALDRRQTYVFCLQEKLDLSGSPIHGRATAKSSVGRLDVLARLIVDGMSGYELFDPSRPSTGELFLEITPNSFPIRVRPGASLCQLRLFHGEPEACEIRGQEIYRACFRGADAAGQSLSANLDPVSVGGLHVAAFRADDARTESAYIDLDGLDQKPDPCRFFRFEQADANRLMLEPSAFYIIRSRERLSIPYGVAVYCRATDESMGEMRIHYAGFAHPGFGQESEHGTPLIFEVRGHDVPLSLRDGESMAKLSFYRMSVDAEPDGGSAYGDQELKLSKVFASWPDRLRRHQDGTVQAGG